MSILHYIKISKPLDFDLLCQTIEAKVSHVAYEQRAENLCYFWIHGASTRGVDLTIEEPLWLELRNTACANHADYELTNQLAETICNLCHGQVYKDNDDYDEELEDASEEYLETPMPLFDEAQMHNKFLSDAKLIRTLVNHSGDPMTLFGPIREVNIGRYLLEKMSRHQPDEQFSENLHRKILEINYHLPDYEYGNLLQSNGDSENPKILKLITNLTPCIIKKYDFILFEKNEKLIAITNDHLNTILPQDWQLVDEYTIVAPIIGDLEFQKLLDKAERFNQIDNL